jgi:hypothetical protein
VSNVIENWNGANSFILYGKGGEIATNDLQNQELTIYAGAPPAADVPCLHQHLDDPACPLRSF